MTCKHEVKNCPRCNGPFECKVGDIAHCQCMTVTLTDEERTFLGERFDDCLCANCMRALKAEFHSKLFHDKLEHISALFTKPKD
ncbi:cysteine-rich CWC family protein [Taibaiella soli]|uniref:Cysteine-rich CWC family protein n=1 Tax=Taibaiella soli TaxID=1649169 RepID=A0A2W2B2X9_9BACT|nr:cysteine-rich CWC family protein [Taibaiella soli]PZF74644.1 hypothetical protein DN068_03440 [Taibaiella soli]